MSAVSENYELDVARGPNWLFVTLRCDPAASHDWSNLAWQMQQTLQRHLTYRLIVELNQARRVCGGQIAQLLALQRWLHAREGTLRLCGLSAEVEALFRCCGLDRLFRVYPDVHDALLGRAGPGKPR